VWHNFVGQPLVVVGDPRTCVVGKDNQCRTSKYRSQRTAHPDQTDVPSRPGWMLDDTLSNRPCPPSVEQRTEQMVPFDVIFVVTVAEMEDT